MSPRTPDCCCIGLLKCSSRSMPPPGSWTSTRSHLAARTGQWKIERAREAVATATEAMATATAEAALVAAATAPVEEGSAVARATEVAATATAAEGWATAVVGWATVVAAERAAPGAGWVACSGT